MSLYISPSSSKEGNESPLPPPPPPPPPPPINLKPRIHLSLVDQKIKRGPTFPVGTFSNNSMRSPLMSRRWGKAPFFSNAKPASMLERGLKRSTQVLVPGQKGIITINDGPQEEVEVVSVTTKLLPKKVSVYTFKNSSGELFEKDDWDRFEEWDFYMVTEAKPFVPKVRKGGKKKSRKTRRKGRR